MKASTKAKFSGIRQGLNNTKGFSKHDEMIQSMYGVELLDGHQNLGEGGFTYSTRPISNKVSNFVLTFHGKIVQLLPTFFKKKVRNVLSPKTSGTPEIVSSFSLFRR